MLIFLILALSLFNVVPGENPHPDKPRPGTRVMICHDNTTMIVRFDSIEGHLAHGDYLGGCQ